MVALIHPCQLHHFFLDDVHHSHQFYEVSIMVVDAGIMASNLVGHILDVESHELVIGSHSFVVLNAHRNDIRVCVGSSLNRLA